MTIETRQLRYFVAVAEERHFGRAAERLQMAQPPLSQQIKQLETSLGTTLFHRTTRSVELTPAGERLFRDGQRVLDELDFVESNVKRIGKGLQGILRLGFTGAATYGLMPDVVRAASQEFPDVALEVTGENLTPGLLDALESRHIDIAVLRPPITGNVSHSVVATEKLVAAVPAESALASQKSIVMRELVGHDLVGYPPNSAVTQAIDAAWRERNVEKVTVQDASETSTLMSLVAAGMGIALVPASATAMRIGGTTFIDVADAPNVELAIAWRSDETSPSVLAFVPFLEGLITTQLGRSQ